MAKRRILSTLLAIVMSVGILPATPLVTAFAETGAPTSTTFVDGTKDDQWTILRELTTGPLAYGLEKGRGLQLKTQPSGMQTDATSSPYNVFTRSGNAESWEAIAKIYYPVSPLQNYQQIAFGVIEDDYNYIKLDIEYNSGNRRVQFSINREGVYSHTHYTNLNNAIFPAELDANRSNNLIAYYKIEKNNNVYKASVSFDGATYYTVGSRSGSSGGSNTNGEYTADYKNPKIYISALKDYDDRSAIIDAYCEYVKMASVNGVAGANVLDSAFQDVVKYVTVDASDFIASVPGSANIATESVYNSLLFSNLPKIPYDFSYRLTPGDASMFTIDNANGAAIARKKGTTTLKLELVNGTRTQLLKTVEVNVNEGNDSLTVEFYYNYTGAPATRPASFTKHTLGGKLDSFPIEQTLPQVGSRADYGFVGWYKNPEGTGEKVTLDTVITEDTNLYAKWEQVPSLWKEYEDYFLMGAFQDYSSTTNAQWNKHYNILCPSNNFKLSNQINTTTMRNNFVSARNTILANSALSAEEKASALQKANEEVVLVTNPSVMTQLNNIRTWNAANPNDKKYTRFHVVAWHGGQQPNQFFTNAFSYSSDNASLANRQDLADSTQDGAFATRETMKARLDNYIKQVIARYEPYKDIIVSWDIVNEPVDDFTGQIRNGIDSASQRGQWGLVWHDMNPARNIDGSPKYTTLADSMGIISNQERLYDESEWMRWAFESAAKWSKEYNCNWGLYVNDYMDSNKLYTKLQPTLDVTEWINDDVDLKGIPLGFGLQGRLAWAYPTIEMLRKQVEDALKVADIVGVTEADVRSDFEPNPFFDPTQATRPVVENDKQQWISGDPINSGSGNYAQRSTLMNVFDTHNSPVRRIPEWGTGDGLNNGSARYNATKFLPLSEELMKKQADFAADMMDIFVDHADKVEMFQWDGYSDSNTFNSSKGAQMWVNNLSNYGGRTGTFEKYSFFAVIGSPARDKLKQAIRNFPDYSYIACDEEGLNSLLASAQELLGKRIYTLEGVNDVKDMTKAINDAAALVGQSNLVLTYDTNNGSGLVAKEFYKTGVNATVKNDSAVGFTNSGYTFVGWNETSDGSGKSYAFGAKIPMNAGITLYAQWSAMPKTFTVAFESYDNGTGASLINKQIDPIQVNEGSKITAPAKPRKEAHIFGGWFRDMALTSPWNFEENEVNENMRLYAKWEKTAPLKLTSIMLDGAPLAGFSPDTYNYTLNYEGPQAAPIVTATANSECNVKVIQASTVPGTAVVEVSNDVTYSVYTIVFAFVTPSANAIYVNGAPIPDFSPSELNYAFNFPVGPKAINITAALPSNKFTYTVTAPASVPGKATLTVNSSWGTSTVYSIDLDYAVKLGKDFKTVTVDLSNSGAEDKNVKIILASYTKEGKLFEVKSSEMIKIPANYGCVFNSSVTLTGDTMDKAVKAFIWDDQYNAYTNAWDLKEPKEMGYFANLALKQPVRASTNESANTPANVVDGLSTTRWAASSGSYPNWIEVDLGEVCDLETISASWYVSGARAYYYTIWARSDEITNWSTIDPVGKDFEAAGYTKIADKSSGNTTTGTNIDSVAGVSARYIVIRCNGTSTGSGSPSIYEIEVAGSKWQ